MSVSQDFKEIKYKEKMQKISIYFVGGLKMLGFDFTQFIYLFLTNGFFFLVRTSSIIWGLQKPLERLQPSFPVLPFLHSPMHLDSNSNIFL